MALEDIAAFRAVHGSVVLHPSDANQTARLVTELADRPGISYLRTLRGKTVVRTGKDEDVRIGGSRTLRRSDDDRVTLIACGITVGESEEAADRLAAEGVTARVLDCYSIKPIDAATLRAAARDTGLLVTIEDHWGEGGLGDAVLDAIADLPAAVRVRKLAVREMPGSGSPGELLAAAGLDADHIAAAARDLLTGDGPRTTAGRKDPFGETPEEERAIIRGEQGTSTGDPHDDTDPQSG
jgi:transketolase